MDAIQEYQEIKQKHRQAEINVAKAKTQADLYRKEIAKILEEENVSSIEELCEVYKKEVENLRSITSLLKQEVEKSQEVMNRLGIV